MQVSSPESGEVAVHLIKFRDRSFAAQTEWFQSRGVSEICLEALRYGNHSVRSNIDAYRDIFLMSRPPLLTQERTPAPSPSPIVPNSQYEPSPTQKLRYFRRPTLAAAFNIDVSDLDFKEEEPVTAKYEYRIVRFDMKWNAL
jgi:hypothetical protein